MERGETAAACRRFEESQRLDPLPGTLLNLAVCHEKEGRTATAWVEFHDAEVVARRDGREDRVALAAERARSLERRLLRLSVVVAPEAETPGLAVALDGADLARPAWGNPLPVDPGEHVVEASAAGKVTRSVRVTLAGEGQVRTVTVDRLEDVPAPASSSPASAPAPPPPTVVPETPAPSPALPSAAAVHRPPEPTDSNASNGRVRREVAVVLGALSVAGLAVGTVFGVDAFAKHGASDAQCPAANQCTAAGVAYNEQSQTSADRSTVAFGASIAVIGVAAYLWFSAPSATPPASSALRIAPVAAREGGGLVVVGGF